MFHGQFQVWPLSCQHWKWLALIANNIELGQFAYLWSLTKLSSWYPLNNTVRWIIPYKEFGMVRVKIEEYTT